MILKQCYLTHNDCYSKPTYITGAPTGIVVHDTGAGNPWLKRYVQPREDNPDMSEILEDLGKNTNNNHWNKSQSAGESNRYACVHAFIGKNAKGVIEVYETLPYDICCWGVGAIPYDKNGNELKSAKDPRFHHYGKSYNYNPQARIQFEICDDGYKDEKYFEDCMRVAVEYCAYLCKMFGFGVSQICNHHESYKMGYGGNHSDTDVWMTKFGKDMDWFRKEVDKILKGDDQPMTPAERAEFDALKKTVEEHEKQLRIYHYWKELPSWAAKPLKAMSDAGYFAGVSPSDLNINRTKLEVNVQMANILKDKGELNY